MTVVQFRSDGLLERHWYKNPPPNSSEWTHYYEYNDRGQPTLVRGESVGEIRPIRIYEYDSAGRISKLIVPDKNGNDRIYETYAYNANGRKTKITHIEDEPRSETRGPQDCGTVFGLDGTETAYGAPGAATITSIYDEHGRPTEHLFHDAAGELVLRVDFTYDDRGNLVEEVSSRLRLPSELMSQFNPQQLEAIQSMFRHHQLHRYDAHNRRVEKLVQLAPHDVQRETFAYNDHGDMISQISEGRGGGDYDVGEDGQLIFKEETAHSHRTEGRSRYHYDSHGNWTEKIGESADGRIWSIERRTLNYYEAGCG
jgi:hypothetical protein